MNSKDLIKYGLLALGAYLIYKYIEDNGGLSAVLGGTAAAGTGTGTGTAACNFTGQATLTTASAASLGITLNATQLAQITACGMAVATPAQLTQLQAAAVSQKVPNPPTTGSTPPSGGPYVPTDYNPCVGGTAVWNASAGAALNGGAQPSAVPQSAAAVNCIMPQTTAGCPIGQTNVNGVCTVEPAGATLISQQMLNAATAAGAGTTLNMDQWDYYYQMVTGSAFPIDPGSISPGVYSGAGIVDRTTPTDIGTWLAIMQNQAPSLGLSAFYGPGSVKYYAPWLM